jgi:hypothetical protein
MEFRGDGDRDGFQMGEDKAAIEFTDRELRLIAGSLPEVVDQRRLGLFPQVLREWGRTDLLILLDLKPEPSEVARGRFERRAAVQKHAKELLVAIAALDPQDIEALILNLACPPDSFPLGLTASAI